MENSWTTTLEEIADGKFKDRRDGPIFNFNVMKDFGNFYRSWHPALLEAQNQVLCGNKDPRD